MQVRKAIPKDAEQLATLVSMFTETPTTSQQIVQRLPNMQSTEDVIIADFDGLVAGFGCLRLVYNFSDDYLYAEVTDLFVHPDFRRKKVAHTIMGFIDQICREKKIQQLVLITGHNNISAQFFYRSVGFVDWALAMKKKF